MATKKSSPKQQPVRSKTVTAGTCPRNPRHTQVVVYRTLGKVRYCKCNDCGTTWKIVDDEAVTPGLSDTDRQFLADLADGLETAPTTTTKDGQREVDVIQVDAAEAAQAAKTLRRIAA